MLNRKLRFVLILAIVSAAVMAAPLFNALAKPRPLASNAVADAADEPVYKAPAPAAATQPQVDPNKVVLTIGDEKVTAGDFNALVADLPPQTAAQILSRPEGKRRLADELVNMKLLSDEAKRRKLDDNPKTRLLYQQVLAQALIQNLSAAGKDDEQFFNDHKDYFEEVKARHILIATADSPVKASKQLTDEQAKAKADKIKARLDKGEDFAAIARAESDDVNSGADGGDLGSVTRGKMVPPFEKATYALKKGEISNPVRTQFGYHIIQLIDRSTPSFEDAKRRVSQRRFELALDDLKKQTTPVFDESFFGKSPTAEPTTQPAATQPASGNAPGK